LLALADVASNMPSVHSRLVRNLTAATGIGGLGEIRQSRDWFDEGLQEFASDTLHSRSAVESGVFCVGTVHRMLREHSKGVRSHYATLSATLDLALAHQTFSRAAQKTPVVAPAGVEWPPLEGRRLMATM
jgi:hypothetical protein